MTVPPSIEDEGTVVETKVHEKHNITLTCEASGMWPAPNKMYMKKHSTNKNCYIPMQPPYMATVLLFLPDPPGNPAPDIKWLKDGQMLIPDRRYQVLSHGRFLQISGAHVSDTGRYSCLASNSAGDRSRHFNLNVLGTTLHSISI